MQACKEPTSLMFTRVRYYCCVPPPRALINYRYLVLCDPADPLIAAQCAYQGIVQCMNNVGIYRLLIGIL